jgi:hypothetical protein
VTTAKASGEDGVLKPRLRRIKKACAETTAFEALKRRA